MKKTRAQILSLILIFFFSLINIFTPIITMTAGAADQVKIFIAEEVTINQQVITLGSIARIAGIEGKEYEKLEKVKLEQAPRPGYKRRINRQLIKLILQDKGYSPDDFILEMPSVIKVKTGSRTIDGQELIDYAQSFIKRNLPSNINDYKIEINNSPGEIIIPDTQYSIKAKVNNNQKLLGRFTLPLDINVGGKRYKRVYPGFTVDAYKKVFVARRNIVRGNKIKKDDFTREERSLSDIKGKPVTDWNDSLLQDGVLSQPIGKREVLIKSHLKKPVLVGWGDEIQAEVVIGSIRVSTMVKARGSGRKNDFIEVENIRTRQKFKAKIINKILFV